MTAAALLALAGCGTAGPSGAFHPGTASPEAAHGAQVFCNPGHREFQRVDTEQTVVLRKGNKADGEPLAAASAVVQFCGEKEARILFSIVAKDNLPAGSGFIISGDARGHNPFGVKDLPASTMSTPVELVFSTEDHDSEVRDGSALSNILFEAHGPGNQGSLAEDAHKRAWNPRMDGNLGQSSSGAVAGVIDGKGEPISLKDMRQRVMDLARQQANSRGIG
ncbi:MAG: hypothetical protein ACRDTD_27130, partial [Pseudonocardiaceae bacterium]